jgi:hypothetical protein
MNEPEHMLTAAEIPFASHTDRPSLLRESLTPAELRLVSEVFELLDGQGPHALDFAARWIVDLTYDTLQLRAVLHSLMDLVHARARADASRTHRR